MSYLVSKYPMKLLSDFTIIQPGYAFRSEQFTENRTDIPLVKGENVQQGYVDWDSAKYWPIEDIFNYKKYILKVGDIVLAMDRPWVTAGLKWAYIKFTDPQSLLVQRVARLRAKDGLDQIYLRYIISSSYFSAYIQPIVTGVNVPHISGKQIGNFSIPIPKIHIQQKIAAILSSYDELIENNKRRITLLEKMAEELYREWFMRMRFPGYEKIKFKKGIPDGWRTVLFSQICSFLKGKNPDHIFEQPVDSAIPYINIDTLENSINSYAIPDKSSILSSKNDILMLMDGARSGLVFRCCKGIVGSTFALIRSNEGLKNIIFEYLKTGKEAIISNNTGSAIPHANKEFINRMMILLPQDSTLLERFNKFYEALMQQAAVLKDKNTILKRTRDILLARLISGKLSVEKLDIKFPPRMQDAISATNTKETQSITDKSHLTDNDQIQLSI